MQSCIFCIISPVFSVTWSSRSFQYADLLLWFETFLVIINVENSCTAYNFFVKTMMYLSGILWWIQSSRVFLRNTMNILLRHCTCYWCYFEFIFIQKKNTLISNFSFKYINLLFLWNKFTFQMTSSSPSPPTTCDFHCPISSWCMKSSSTLHLLRPPLIMFHSKMSHYIIQMLTSSKTQHTYGVK